MNEIAELWAVSVAGPDDLIPVADYLTAVRLSNTFNEWWASRIKQQGLHEFAPRMWATPVVYNGDTKQHTASIENPSKDYEPFIALLSERHSHESSPAPKEEAGWRPIETAPRDGTYIDLWGEEESARFNRPSTPPMRRQASCRWERQGPTPGEGWYGFALRSGARILRATHWMPLPTPPSASNDGEEK